MEKIRPLCRQLVLQGLVRSSPFRLKLDFDGIVFSNQGQAKEGRTLRLNRKKGRDQAIASGFARLSTRLTRLIGMNDQGMFMIPMEVRNLRIGCGTLERWRRSRWRG